MNMDIFNDDAFSLVSLTAAINETDHVPGRAGALAFAGIGQGVATMTVEIERKGSALTLIQTSARGGPAPKNSADRANLRSVIIPHIKLEDTIQASQVQGVRAFGTTDQLIGPQTAINASMAKMTSRHDLTLEYHRLGALRGVIMDADGTTELTDLFDLFGVTNDNSAFGGGATDKAPKIFAFDLDGVNSDPSTLRVECQAVTRYMARNAKTVIPAGAQYWAFCGDNFFDRLIEREDVREVFKNTTDQERRLGANYAFGAFEFGGIVWENYRGTDDNSTVAIDPDECRIFLVGVPGLYAEYYAPADFMETVNTPGLPRYARVAPDKRFNQYAELHTQQNPLPLCLRPQTLIQGVILGS